MTRNLFLFYFQTDHSVGEIVNRVVGVTLDEQSLIRSIEHIISFRIIIFMDGDAKGAAEGYVELVAFFFCVFFQFFTLADAI